MWFAWGYVLSFDCQRSRSELKLVLVGSVIVTESVAEHIVRRLHTCPPTSGATVEDLSVSSSLKMAVIRPMTAIDLLHFNPCNLDHLTETYNIGFYLEYFTKWPQLCKVIESETGQIDGYILGKLEASPYPAPIEPYDPAIPIYRKKWPNYLPWHAHITCLTIAPAARRLGHATRLSEALERVGDEADAWFVDLFVRVENEAAIQLYKKMGYSIYRRVVDYYNDNSDAFDMRKPLKRDKQRKTIRANGENVKVSPQDVCSAAGCNRKCNHRAYHAASLPDMESFENIYLDLSKQSGKCRLAESGLGWKSAAGQPFTLDKSDFINAQWSRAAKGYELKIYARNKAGVVQLDGFKQEDFDTISKCFKVWYGVEFTQKDHALQGWNWGKTEMGRHELTFNVRNRPAFEVPYDEISNTNLAGKNEVAVEFVLPGEGEENGVNGHTENKGSKSRGALDQLSEVRFYIPGTETRKAKNEDGDDEEDGEDEEANAATLFYETLMDKAEIGEVAGETFATFLDVLHLTPRGRFDIYLYEKSFRLRGKTYDYKIPYDSAKRFFFMPKPDDVHQLLCIGLDPPLRQGQTRYPFLVMQFKKDEEVNIELNMTEDDIKRYDGKLQAQYEAPIGNVIAKIFHGLTGKKLNQPAKDFVSHHNQHGVKCSIKANEGHLYCLDRAFLFIPKPATYISFDNIAVVTMSRVGGAVSASRTFDITVTLKNGNGEHQFSNINREEQTPFERFLDAKNIKYKNEMDSDGAMLAVAADPDLASSEDEEVVNADRGSADEDDESVDEDFQADSDSDVAEEYDSNAASSGDEDGDVDMEDADDDEDTAAKVERPKKKAKTG
ncbi:hypothetical protein AMS68_003746 [Peltaster fructicola]|uniref:N-acetyltransferase domain-containing protein n=1 Tax=Peltaster fructicola TaxID=286661 RepID=A0A6H0XUD1_9PEZI|nr:hypothetical protein AMS68_003746 [Peltaster fructicola]